jgi:N-acetylmuramoyl-L-alanine amidase
MRHRIAALGVLLVALFGATSVAVAVSRIEIDEGVYASLDERHRIRVSVYPEKGEGYYSLSTRMCGDAELATALQASNFGRELVAGLPIHVPWDLLRGEYRYLTLLKLFPSDRFEEGAWVHRPGKSALPTLRPELWQIAVWFTGDGETWQKIAADNGLESPDLSRHHVIRIDESLLVGLFRPDREGAGGRLSYARDDEGPYAVYELARGEALYSSVVLRFTGVLIDDDDGVRAMVEEISRRSGIADVRDIPVGFPVKIPLDLLATRYLPDNHPRAVVARVRAAEMAALEVPTRPTSLDGVHVLVDVGHGGADPGAKHNGVWESDYAYDVAMRVRRQLSRETGAEVHMLVKDEEHGYRVFDARRLARNQRETLQTTPPFSLSDKRRIRPGVNMRWYLANSIFGDLTGKRGVASEKVVFLSIHADALHRSVSGAMVYVPGARFRGGNHRVRGSIYRKYEEWSGRSVRFTRTQRLRDEKISKRLASAIVAGFHAEKLPVHDDRPIRDHVVRRSRRTRRTQRYVPAVIRGNAVPAKALVELVNLSNPADARLLADPDGRERMARAIVGGLRDFYGDE